jgi:hypothetical protein
MIDMDNYPDNPDNDNPDNDNPNPEDICPACDGSGEGQHEGTTCYKCKGSGVC